MYCKEVKNVAHIGKINNFPYVSWIVRSQLYLYLVDRLSKYFILKTL